jgi:putative FmdB family regulatory protein
MPIYEYRCSECDKAFERLVRSDTQVRCPACESAKVERVLSVTARPGGATGSGADYSALGPMKGGGCGHGGCGCH